MAKPGGSVAIDDEIEIVRSNKGGNKLIHRGYMYTIHKNKMGKIRWRCSQRSLHCKGSITTVNDRAVINLPHNHIPDMQAVSLARCRAVPENGSSSGDKNDPGIDFPEESSSSHKSTTTVRKEPAKLQKIVKPPPPEAEVCLRWNSHHSNIQTMFPALMDQELYVDVTIAVEDRLIKSHKVILSSCSPLFEEMLKSVSPNQHPIIFLREFEYWQVKALVDFMYKGEVNIDQNKLELLLTAAESLQIKGLAGKGAKKQPKPSSTPSPPSPPQVVKEEIDPDVDSPAYEDPHQNDEDFVPNDYYCRKLQIKKQRKRKNSIPDPKQLKSVPIKLGGTKSRPNIKQPKFYDPDYPEYDPDRCVSPPKDETDSMIHIDNIKLEPIDFEIPPSPSYEIQNDDDDAMTEPRTKLYKVNYGSIEKEGRLTPPVKKYSNPKKLLDSLKKSNNKRESSAVSETATNVPHRITVKPTEAIDVLPKFNANPSDDEGPSIIVKPISPIKNEDSEKLTIKPITMLMDSKKIALVEGEKIFIKAGSTGSEESTDQVLKKFATKQLSSILKRPATDGSSILVTAKTKEVEVKQVNSKPKESENNVDPGCESLLEQSE